MVELDCVGNMCNVLGALYGFLCTGVRALCCLVILEYAHITIILSSSPTNESDKENAVQVAIEEGRVVPWSESQPKSLKPREDLGDEQTIQAHRQISDSYILELTPCAAELVWPCVELGMADSEATHEGSCRVR